MKNFHFKKVKYDWKFGLLGAAFAFGIFLRVYHFSDWLFFKQDQARDAFIVLQAYQKGPGFLPLLGARAGGTDLLLGPVYYYFQYLAVLLVHNIHPTTFAMPDLFFGVLSVPLFYLFSKKYFSRGWSLFLASALALCFFAIEYSRFAWNCNSLPFFTILYFCALLNVSDPENKRPVFWTITAGLSLAIATQLHFVAFLGLPAITIFFFFLKSPAGGGYSYWQKFIFWLKNKDATTARPKGQDSEKISNTKLVVVFVSSVIFVYLPWILNDLLASWRNTKALFAAINIKTSRGSLLVDIILGFQNFTNNWLTILSGYVPKINSFLPQTLVCLAFILPGLFINIYFLKKETNPNKKNFLLLSLLWFVIYLIVFLPIGDQLRPRYILAILMLPMIYLGYIFVYLSRKMNRGRIIIPILAALVILGNLWGTYLWFGQIKEAQVSQDPLTTRTFIFKSEDGVVLRHLSQAAEYIKETCGAREIRFITLPDYFKPMDYMLRYNNAGIESPGVKNPNGICYYAIAHSKSGLDKIRQNINDNFSVVSQRKFAVIAVFQIEPSSENTTDKGFYNITDNETNQEAHAINHSWNDLGDLGKK